MYKSTYFVGGLTITSCKNLLKFKVLQIDSIIFRSSLFLVDLDNWDLRFHELIPFYFDPLYFLRIMTIQGGKSLVFTYHQFSCSKNLYIPPRYFIGYLWNFYQLTTIECCNFVDQLLRTSLLVWFCCQYFCPSSRVGSGSILLPLITVHLLVWFP